MLGSFYVVERRPETSAAAKAQLDVCRERPVRRALGVCAPAAVLAAAGRRSGYSATHTRQAGQTRSSASATRVSGSAPSSTPEVEHEPGTAFEAGTDACGVRKLGLRSKPADLQHDRITNPARARVVPQLLHLNLTGSKPIRVLPAPACLAAETRPAGSAPVGLLANAGRLLADHDTFASSLFPLKRASPSR